jgi:hypothetical protein
VYQLEKVGGFEGAGSAESRQFIAQRMAYGATMLRDLWYTAWLDSAADPPPPQKPASPPPPKMKTTPKLGDTPSEPGS